MTGALKSITGLIVWYIRPKHINFDDIGYVPGYKPTKKNGSHASCVFLSRTDHVLSDPTHKTAHSDDLSVFNLQVELKPRPALEKKVELESPNDWILRRRFSVFHGKFFTNSRA